MQEQNQETLNDSRAMTEQDNSMASIQSGYSYSSDQAETKALGNLNERKAPLNGGQDDDSIIEDDLAAINVTADEEIAKKKKKGKSKGQKAAKAGTGFEEYYVDAPLTPAEHEHEKGLYHASLPFTQRVETAIQRYVAKRNMDSTRKNIFDKYLIHGGVEGGPKMFLGGNDSQALETGDAQDIALMTATNFMPFDKIDPNSDVYVVDFEGSLKAFLSYTVPSMFDLTSQAYIKCLAGVIRNFMNYLLHHDVCPEYQDQIQASKLVCDQGERELWAIAQAIVDLPGDFNKACSELFGGVFQGQWTGNAKWLTEEESAELLHGISPSVARQVFKLGVVANTSTEQFEKYESETKSKSIKVHKIGDISMEVIGIIPSNTDVQRLYASQGSLKPLGKLLTKSWHTTYAPLEDMTEAEEIIFAHTPKKDELYEFWVEDEILCHCFLGMKIDATVRELSIGISYFDAIQGVYCSFFDISANQRMADWKEPEGEGKWLPMRTQEGAPLEDGSKEDGDCERVDEKSDNRNVEDSPPESSRETTGGSRLEHLEPGNIEDGGGSTVGTIEGLFQGKNN